MANPLLNSSFFGAPTNNAPTQNGSSNLFGDLLAQARHLGNGSTVDQNGFSQLPNVRPTLPEIERQSETVIGRGRGRGVRGGEGHSLLNRHGINTISTAERIGQLAGSQAGPSGLSESAAPPRRRRRLPEAYGGQGMEGVQAAQGDIHAWGRNWHENVILEGIEAQRKNTVKEFNKQFQSRMAANWEEEKKKVLQNELGVAQDDLNGSVLGRSTLGQSQRRFPLAQSTTKSAENTQGGIVMNNRMKKYSNAIESINRSRLARRNPQVCQQLSNAGQTEQSPDAAYIVNAFSLISYLVQEPGAAQNVPPLHERQFAKDYLADGRSHEKRRLNERIAAGAKRYLEADFLDHMEKQITANTRIASLGGQPGILNKVRGYAAIQLASRDAEKFHAEKVNGVPLYMHVWYLLRSGHSAEAIDMLASNQQNVKREDAALPGALKSYFAAADHRLGRGQRDQLMNDFNNHIRGNPTGDVFKAALYKLIGRFDMARKNFKVAADTTEDWIWGNLMLVREAGSVDEGPSEKYDLADFGKLVQDYGSRTFDADGAKWATWVNMLLCAGEFESAVGYLHSKSQLRTDAVHLGIALTYYGLLRIPENPEDQLCITRDVGFERGSWFNFYRMIRNFISPFCATAPETALQYAYLVALNGDLPDLGPQQKQLALDLVRDIVLASRQWSKLLGTIRSDGVKQIGLIERDLKLLDLHDPSAHIHSVILSAAEQSNIDASLVDSIELYHLANAPEKVIDAVTRSLAQSLSLHSGNRSVHLGQRLDLQGAFGGTEDILQLASTVLRVYEHDNAARQVIGPKKWEALGTLSLLKRAMGEFDADRPEQALETFRQSEIIPLETTDPTTISRDTARFAALLDNNMVSDLDEVVITVMKCIHKLSTQLNKSQYADAGSQQQVQRLKGMAMALIQFASGLRLRLGGDVYRQLSSMSAFL